MGLARLFAPLPKQAAEPPAAASHTPAAASHTPAAASHTTAAASRPWWSGAGVWDEEYDARVFAPPPELRDADAERWAYHPATNTWIYFELWF